MKTFVVIFSVPFLPVMPGLDPGIQGPLALRLPPWIAGSSPAMTMERHKNKKGASWKRSAFP
jgi:hypothetical protein